MLKVRIYSFGFRKSGIPADTASNGGGFVFDCRFIKNPGVKTEFLNLTGKDNEVIKYLENMPDIQKFIKDTFDIVSMAINNFLTRGFSDIMVSYGCTGGQHRSVYAAEKLKQKLQDQYDGKITVEVHHVEFPELSD